ncbi:MAG TPA: hypothetical protein PL003_07645 [Bacteroidales bacterium]|nr:hypothetical protein [Bacteroidales bacterium]
MIIPAFEKINKTMKPMGLTSTPFLSYRDIDTTETDLYDDAWGFYPQFRDVIETLKILKSAPDQVIIRRLLKKLRQVK